MRLLAHRTRLTAGIGVLAFTASAFLPAASQAVAAESQGTRAAQFQAAASEFHVPQSVLIALSYNQTRLEDHDGAPSVSGGYGLMHLTTGFTQEDHRGDPSRPLPTAITPPVRTLDEAAGLLGVAPDVLKHDERQNIRGGAAVLASYAKQTHGGTLPTAVPDYYEALTKMAATTDQQAATSLANDVLATIGQGIQVTTTDGQVVRQAPEAVSLPESVMPSTLRAPASAADVPRPECPRRLQCRFVPARHAQNNPADPKDYGNYDIANRSEDTQIKYIVIHDTEGSYDSSIAWFQDPASYVAAHYVIRSSDGEVTQMVPTKDIGWHAGNWYMNMHSIGVEHEGFAATGATWYTDAMYRSSALLVRYLADKYDVPLDRQHIIGHEQLHGLTPARAKAMHTDPGPYWDWERYMKLLGAPVEQTAGRWSDVVTIAPRFAANMQPVGQCLEGTCADLPLQKSNLVYLRTEPRSDAPYLSDPGLHPDGLPGTTEITDTSAKAVYGQVYSVAERRGDWLAVWFGGYKGWLYNPRSNRTVVATEARVVTPKSGVTSIPVYGRPIPEAAAFPATIPVVSAVPLQYTIPAGQKYVAYDRRAANDYLYALTFDHSVPDDGTIVMGNEKYIPISYGHRQGYVKASDITSTR